MKLLAQQEREATAALIAHLAVLDERRLYLAEGCSSMFTYCVQVLQLLEHAAYGRIEAARAARRYPVLLDMLVEGSVNLTTVGLLAPHLTEEDLRAPSCIQAQKQAAGRRAGGTSQAPGVCAFLSPQTSGSQQSASSSEPPVYIGDRARCLHRYPTTGCGDRLSDGR